MRKHKKSIAIQGDSLNTLNRTTDTTLLLALEAQKRGYKIYYYETKNLTFVNNRVVALCKEVKFNRYNIFKRDRSECQYCMKAFPRNELTIDHVHPKSLGGRTVWENVVCCCIKCNRRKGNKLLQDTDMKLSIKPTKPSWELLSNLYLQTIKFNEWRPFLTSVDTSYWNVELEE